MKSNKVFFSNSHSIQQELPPGLLDANIEVFASGTQLMALYQGTTVLFEKLPEDILAHFINYMKSDKLAMDIMSCFFTSEIDMLKQYTWCNFGGWNRKPDFNGQINVEYWNCGQRGKCKHEGKICSKINPDEKNPTSQEFKIMELISSGLCDKEIAAKLGTSLYTVTTQRQTIERKLKARCKVDVAAFVLINNLPASNCCLPKPPVA